VGSEVTEFNCAVECVNGCKLGDQCPHREHQAEVAKFIEETPLSEMLEMAEAAIQRKRMAREVEEAPKWVYPEDGIPNPDA
jgi:hypothetical protein